MTKSETFLSTYEQSLIEEITRTPQNYSYGVDKVPTVMERAKAKFYEAGIKGFALNGQAIRLTYKKLGIPKVTYKAFEEWLVE